jgi:hypothetical protein
MDEIVVEVRYFKMTVRLTLRTTATVARVSVVRALDRWVPEIKARLIAGDYENDLPQLFTDLSRIPNLTTAQVLVEDSDDPDIRRGVIRHY